MGWSIDLALLAVLQPLLLAAPYPAWVVLSAPGAAACTLTATGIGAAAMATARRWWAAALAIVGTAGGYGLMYAVKSLVAKERPTLDPTRALDPDSLGLAAWDPASMAFPSGHAMLALVTYGYLASCLPPGLRPAGWLLAGAIALLVGLSRVALGAHWPTDILGSWLIGGAWLAVVIGVRSLATRPRREEAP